MEVTNIEVLLPVIIKFKENDEEFSAFAYINNVSNSLVIPDIDEDVQVKLKEAYQVYKSKQIPLFIPSPPTGKFDNANSFKPHY